MENVGVAVEHVYPLVEPFQMEKPLLAKDRKKLRQLQRQGYFDDDEDEDDDDEFYDEEDEELEAYTVLLPNAKPSRVVYESDSDESSFDSDESHD